MKKTLCLTLALSLLACGEIKELDIKEIEIEELDPLHEEVVYEPQNPRCGDIMKFRDGTLWKPKGDHSGALVVLIRDLFVKPFDSCYVVDINGVEEQMVFTGFSNGDRQTWRAMRPGGRYMNTFTCVQEDQTCIWQFKGDSGERHE